MDPSAENGPPKAELAEVDIEIGLKERPIPTPILTAPLANSIFRDAREPGWDRPVEESDSDQVRAWQEEEFQRRLRGEYEEAQQRVGQVVHSNMDRPMRLTSIRLAPPPPTTRTTFLTTLLQPFISYHPFLPSWLNPAPPPARNLHDILISTKALVTHIDKLGIFDMERVGVRLEPRAGGDADEVEMVLSLREKGRLFLKAGTEFGGNEGGGNVTARIRNAFGGGESLEVNASIGTKTKSAYQATLSAPVLASPYLTLALSGFSLDRDNTAFASHRETSQGGRVKLSALSPWGSHDLMYEYARRDIGHLSPRASASIRELANQTTKASISHVWTSDTRDDPWLGTSGRLLKATHEFAGLPGSSELSHFLKSTTQSQVSRALYPGSNIHFSISSLTTILYPLWAHSGSPISDGTPRATYLADRTFLGGPNSVRGWKIGGLGLRDGADSLGGDLAFALGLSVFFPIPRKEHWPLKVHSFLNLGKVVGYDTSRSFGDNIGRMYSNPNVSVGVGLMYRFDPLRVELNFSMPLIARRGERLSRGLGVGVGIEFL